MRACSDEQRRHENLDELLRDPIVGLVMASDGVDPAELRALLIRRAAPERAAWPPGAGRPRREPLQERGPRHR